jgi:RNase P subunit RPR2
MSIVKPSETCKHRIVNFETGEVIDCDHIPTIRSRIKEWATQTNVKYSSVQAISSSRHVAHYLMSVFYDYKWSTCDVCNKPIQRKDMEFVEDSNEVCLVAMCKHCDDELQEDIDDMHPTNEDIAEWQGNYNNDFDFDIDFDIDITDNDLNSEDELNELTELTELTIDIENCKICDGKGEICENGEWFTCDCEEDDYEFEEILNTLETHIEEN